MAQTVADLKVRFGADGVETVEQAAARANKSVTGIGSTLKGVAITAGGFLAAQAITKGATIVRDNIRGTIDAASDLGESLNKNSQIFGKNAGEMQSWAKGAAQNLGISQQQALETSATFGNLLKGAGVANDQLPKMSKNIVQAASDLASFNNASPEDTLQAIQSGIVGEVEPLRKYGILLSEAAVQQKAMAMTGKSNAKELTNGEKAAARYALIMDQLGDAQGDFQRTSKGLANQERILAARRKDLAATIGRFLLPAQLAWTRAMLGTTNALIRGIPAVASFLRPVADLGRIVSAAFTGRWGEFNKIVEKLPEPLQRSGHALGVIVEGFADLFAFMRRGDWDRFFTRLPGELQQIAGGFSALGDELLQGATFVANIAIDTVVSITGWLWDHRGDIWGGIKSLVGWSVDNIVEGISWTLKIGVPKLIGWTVSSVEDLLLRMIYGQAGDGTGGPQPHGSPTVALKAWALNVAVPTLAGWATSAAGWINTKLQQIVDGAVKVAPRIADWAIDVGIPTAQGWIDQAQTWLDAQVHEKLDGTKVSLTDWSLDLSAPSISFGAGRAKGINWGERIREKIGHIDVTDFKTWTLVVSAPVAVTMGLLAAPPVFATLIMEKLTGISVLDFARWTLEVGIPATLGAVVGFAEGLSPEFTGLVKDAAVKVEDFTEWALNIGIPHLSLGFTLDALKVLMASKVSSLGLPDGIKLSNAFSWALELVSPSISLGFDLKTLEGLMAAKVATLGVPHVSVRGVVNWVFGSGDDDKPEPQNNPPYPSTPGNGPRLVGANAGMSGLFGGGFGAGSLLSGFTIPAPKDNASPVIDGVRKALESLTSATWQPTLDLNPRPLLDKLASATVAGGAFAKLTWIPTADLNPASFLSKLTSATLAGTAFARSIFRATLDGDTGPFGGAVASAAGLGALFSRTTFTASLDADTTPFWTKVNGLLGTTLGTAYVTLAAANTIDPAASVKGRAGGGMITEPLTLVGERGPELISAPGYFVHTANATNRMLGGPVIVNLTVNGAGIRDEERLARAIGRELSRELTLMRGAA